MKKNYYVYKHTFPNGKVYIRITSLKPEYRWNNGKGYLKKTKNNKYDQPLMAYAINKYGWDNVEHEILFKGLSKKTAELKEIELISQYKSDNREFGYNLEKGGNIHGYNNIVFSEIKEVELVLRSGEITQDNVSNIVNNMIAYNFIVKNMSNNDNHNNVIEWIKSHYKYYIEGFEYCDINQIKNKITYKFPINDLIIYQSELDKISSLENISYEKVLFVILCIAKLQRNVFDYKNGEYKIALTNIFNFARVHIKSSDRDSFIQRLLNKGYINAPHNVDSDYKCVSFISDGNNDEEVLYIDENDFAELAYVYENWKNGGTGFTRCTCCRKLIPQSKTRPKKYCESCAKEVNKQKSKERTARYRKNIQ